MDHVAKAIGARIRARRLALGLEQTDVALAVRVSSGSVSRWERGAYPPSWEALGRLATALQCSVPDLLPSAGGEDAYEAELLGLARGLDPDGRALALDVLRAVRLARTDPAILEMITGLDDKARARIGALAKHLAPKT
jgi:transcriptional regulator with XRE-family HTH domain